MDDKTSSLLPSTPFDAAHTPTPHHISSGLTSASPSTFSPINRKSNMTARPQFDSMGSLMSPPESTPYDSFSRESPARSMASSQIKPTEPKTLNLLLSPPVSPQTKNTGPDTLVTVKDPILYPNQDSTSSQPPLFIEDEDAAAQRLVDEHIRQRHETVVSPPKRDEYVLALEFKSQVAKMFNADRRGWHSRERQYLIDAQRIRNNAGRRYFPTIKPMPTQQVAIEKIPRTPKPPREKVQADRVKKPVPRKHAFGSATPEPKAHRNSPLTTTREDKDFNALPDYCPPLTSLPMRPNSLKVEWKGAPIDLSADPFRDLLHPDEISLAANLRLDCATYLTSKRRIFMARLEKLRAGKEFRKTDSQQACKIDVNKASKLWSAFEKVGWLRQEWVRQYV